MLALFIHFLEAVVVALVGFLFYRLVDLNAAEQKTISKKVDTAIKKAINHSKSEIAASVYEGKMESLKKAQVFVGVQLVEVKRDFPDFQRSELEWLKEAISLYLIGAVDFIGKQGKCDIKSRKEMINLALKTSLKLKSDEVANYFNEALNRQAQSDSDHMVRAGARAAKVWLKNNQVPSEFCLRAQLNEWGIFA